MFLTRARRLAWIFYASAGVLLLVTAVVYVDSSSPWPVLAVWATWASGFVYLGSQGEHVRDRPGMPP